MKPLKSIGYLALFVMRAALIAAALLAMICLFLWLVRHFAYRFFSESAADAIMALSPILAVCVPLLVLFAFAFLFARDKTKGDR